MAAPNGDFISLRAACVRLGLDTQAAKKVMALAGVRVQEYPGMNPRYCREDVFDLAERSVKRMEPAEASA